MSLEEKTTKDVIEEYINKVNEGVSSSALALCYLYLTGEDGVEVDIEKAKLYLTKTLELGVDGMEYEVGLACELLSCDTDEEENNEYAKMAFEYFVTSADNGNVDALCSLGDFYDKYLGDGEKALEYYEEAANKGCFNAYYALGNFYMFGEYVEEDLDKAYECFEKAANMGHSLSCYIMGCKYYSSDLDEENIEEVDYAKASYWFNKAYQNGKFDALYDLIDIAEASEDYKQALVYINEGIKEEDSYCYYLMAHYYKNGLGVVEDPIKESYYLGLASDEGDLLAERLLAFNYASGRGVEKSYDKAKELLDDIHSIKLNATSDDPILMTDDIFHNNLDDDKVDYEKIKELYNK